MLCLVWATKYFRPYLYGRKLGTGKYVKLDQTPAQREYLGKVLKELADRKSKGETDIKIKYINNIPKIIKYKPTHSTINDTPKPSEPKN